MPVLIDGNNLLHAALADEPERPVGRARLCELLSAWALRSRERVHIVFDGPAPPENLLAQHRQPGIELTFSAPLSGDDALRRLIEADSAARRLVVVSSDREVVRAARRRRARSLRSQEFWAVVRRELHQRPPGSPPEPPEKQTGLSADQTENWLREFGL